jgi:hypothetical protein
MTDGRPRLWGSPENPVRIVHSGYGRSLDKGEVPRRVANVREPSPLTFSAIS